MESYLLSGGMSNFSSRDSPTSMVWNPIIIKHPNVGRSLQCLQCGTIGHPAARCQFTNAQIKGPGAIEVTEAELQDVEDLAKPFLSPEEKREMASKRLQLQRVVDAAAQAAVTPASVRTTPPRRLRQCSPSALGCPFSPFTLPSSRKRALRTLNRNLDRSSLG